MGRFPLHPSFVDFAEDGLNSSLLYNEILEQYPHLVVMKSISKSYGVPGLRLGVLASSDKSLVAFLKKDVSIWNINSFAEFYMQIFGKYESAELSRLLLDRNILIKDCGTKKAFGGKNYIRIAVKNRDENNRLISILASFDL